MLVFVEKVLVPKWMMAYVGAVVSDAWCVLEKNIAGRRRSFFSIISSKYMYVVEDDDEEKEEDKK